MLQYATTRSQKSEINKKRANDTNIGSEQCHILGGAEIQSDWKKRGGNGSPKRVDSLLPCAWQGTSIFTATFVGCDCSYTS